MPFMLLVYSSTADAIVDHQVPTFVPKNLFAMTLERFSLGLGDRFGKQGVAQLAALQQAASKGVAITPVWNKSNREHNLIGTGPADTQLAAQKAVQTAGWTSHYHLDADHIGLKTVDRFLPHCDFYTIDVADFIRQPATPEDTNAVRTSLQSIVGRKIPELGKTDAIPQSEIDTFLSVYATAIREAGRIYLHIAKSKGEENFIAEVSTDEAETPQSPFDLYLILGALAGEGVRVQTIAPKFSGRFNKGVDYVGNVNQFTLEFAQDLTAIRMAVAEFGLPSNLKISVHSGSDKFSLYRPIQTLLAKHDAGLHLKTAGTTWLEELIGLSLAGGDGLSVAREIYIQALARIDELSQPYATVIDIDRSKLPQPAKVNQWDGQTFADTLTHDLSQSRFNPSFRQLLHVSFKVAAEMGDRYQNALDQAQAKISACVTTNLFQRHIHPLFFGQ